VDDVRKLLYWHTFAATKLGTYDTTLEENEARSQLMFATG